MTTQVIGYDIPALDELTKQQTGGDIPAMSTPALVDLGNEMSRLEKWAGKNKEEIGASLKDRAAVLRLELGPEAKSVRLDGTKNRKSLIVWQNRVSCGLEGLEAGATGARAAKTFGQALPLFCAPKIGVTGDQAAELLKWEPQTKGQRELKKLLLGSLTITETAQVRYQG